MAKQHLTDTEAKAVEKRIGRPLTLRERASGELDRVDSRSHIEQMQAARWRPKMATDPKATIHDAAVAEAERAADEERFMALSPAQRRLKVNKDAQARELRERADAKTLADHLAKHGPQLEKLRALLDSTRLDPTWSVAEVEAIARAITQIEAGPLADAEETSRLYQEPLKTLTAKKQALRDQSATKRAELAAQIAALDADLASLGGKPTTNAELAKLATAKDAWAYFKEKFNGDANDNSPEANEARSRWLELDKAEAAASESGTANYD